MFAARGFNIDSLVVGRTENPELSRMTIVCTADDNTIEQVRKQLAKLVPVVKVRDFKDAAYVERDLLLAKIGVGAEKRREVVEIVELFRGHVSDVAVDSVMVELVGAEEKLEAFIELMKPYGIEEVARTGVIAMARGTNSKQGRRDVGPVEESAPAASTPRPPLPCRRARIFRRGRNVIAFRPRLILQQFEDGVHMLHGGPHVLLDDGECALAHGLG